jgi:hypothetical protein
MTSRATGDIANAIPDDKNAYLTKIIAIETMR